MTESGGSAGDAPADPTAVLARRAIATLADSVLGTVVLVVAFVGGGYQLWERQATASIDAAIDVCETFEQQVDPGVGTGEVVCLPIGSDAFLVDLPETLRALIVVQVVATVFQLLNVVVLQGLTGASAGKHLSGLRVVRPDGSIAGFGRHVLRWLALFVEGGLIAAILVFVTTGHRRLGDYLADTYVVATASVGDAVAIPGHGPPPLPPPGTPIWDPTLDTYVTLRPDLGGWLAWDDHAQTWRLIPR
jgi:hypothetical protein